MAIKYPIFKSPILDVKIKNYWTILCVCLSLSVFIASGFSAPEKAEDDDSQKLKLAKKLFVAHCGRCHGMAGGGGTGPSLVRPRLPRAPDDDALRRVIKGGIGGTGMPGNWMLSSPEVKQLVTYVRSLGKTPQESLSGDPARGRQIYQTAQCAACHIIRGKGGSLGPELTRIGSQRGADHVRKALLHPGTEKPRDANGFITYLIVRVVKSDGTEIEGMRLNEDSFTIQLRDSENRFYSFRKRDLKKIQRKYDLSIMPSFEEALAEEPLEDLVAYLFELQGK